VTRHLGDELLVDIDEAAVLGYQSSRLKELAAPKSVNEEVRFLLTMMEQQGDIIRASLRKKKKLKLPARRKIGKAYEADETQRMRQLSKKSRSPHIYLALIALQSGQEISTRLLSGGDWGNTPVDFVVNYRPPQSFLIGSSDVVAHGVETARDEKPRTVPVIDQALKTQAEIATPDWVGGLAKNEKNPDGKAIGKPLVAALGDAREKGDEMLIAYSVMNTTDQWIEVLPPQVELNSPNLGGDKKKKKREILAEQVPITDYRLNVRRLAPGERADGAVQFARPGFKQSKDRLLLQLATASAVDTPLLLPIPFVAPGR
jgi:hypothetical protein